MILTSYFIVGLLFSAAPPLHDDAQLLYSTQLKFAENGDPIVTVGLMDEQDSATISAAAGFKIHLAGPAGGVIETGPESVLVGRVRNTTPATTRWRVILDAFPGGSLSEVQEGRLRWKQRKVDYEVHEIGGFLGFPKKPLDNRKVLLLDKGHFHDSAAAKVRAEELRSRFGLNAPIKVMAEPLTRPHGRIEVRERSTGMIVSQLEMLAISALDGGPITVHNVEFAKGYAKHGFEDRRYHGDIILAVDKTGKLAVVNRLSAELLLQGVVPSEIFSTAPAASLRAQAITARGELFAPIGLRNRSDPYVTCSTQLCQVYGGITKERESTNRAVQETRGKVIFGADGRLVKSVYHSNSGGFTENNEHVWGTRKDDALRGKPDAPPNTPLPWPQGQVPTERQLRDFLQTRPPSYSAVGRGARALYRWTREYDRAELNRLVNKKKRIGPVRRIEVVERGISGRVRKVRFIGRKKSLEVRWELSVRRLLANLRSGLFVVDRTSTGWRFVGGGFGHGVGMSQYGAMRMAERGSTEEEILSHYYTGSRVVTIY